MISVAAAIGVPMKLTPWVYINFNTYYIARPLVSIEVSCDLYHI